MGSMADSLFEFFHSQMILYFEETFGEEQIQYNMEKIGYRVGFSLVEKATKEEARFKENVEIVKYICKDLWQMLFRKQADNLKTNHTGTFVIQDNRFRFLNRVSQSKQYLDRGQQYAAFTCGVVRGALTNFGMPCTVTSEVNVSPTCKFQISIQGIS
ncbi:trafficking protein particle complex subunit 6b-like [Bolinopsis microptera]|uniref:trafficking protein particle complex subunit 6b-like n=1 Tax=Bolinopsis microptera TaxID=2820187 RepID=UPI003079C8D6